MTQMRKCALTLAMAAALASCSSGLRPTGVAAVLPSDVAQKLPRELMAFVDELPADVSGFGYLDFGAPMDQFLDLGPEYRPMMDDLLEMTRRRWGVDPRRARGVGVARVGDKFVYFGDVGAAVAVPSDPSFAVGRLGAFTIVGEPPAVQAVLASAKQGKLAKQRLPWVQSALARAAGQLTFYSFPGDKLPPPTTPTAIKTQAAILHGTVTVSASGFASYLTAKPGQVATVRAPVETALAEGRVAFQALGAMGSGAGIGAAMQGILARHYGTALLAGMQVSAAGDELTIALPWHAPAMPAPTPAPALGERVVTHGEWAVMQLDLGQPLLRGLVSITDVLGAPLDRSKLVSELLAELTKAMDVPAMDPRAATVSVGGMSALVSLHGDKPTLPGGMFGVAHGQVVGAATPWGIVATAPNMTEALQEALDESAQGMPLAESSRFAADRSAMVRAMVDLSRLPPMLKIMASELPIHSVELAASATRFEADVVVKSGQLAQVQQLLNLFIEGMTSELGSSYQDRKKASATAELGAIIAHHQIQIVRQVLTPKVQGDRLTFVYAVSPQLSRSLWIIGVLGAIGGISAPAFQQYLQQQQAPSAIAN